MGPRRHHLWVLSCILAPGLSCGPWLHGRLDQNMGEGARQGPAQSTPFGVLEDPQVFEDAEYWLPPTPTAVPTPPPDTWDTPKRLAWAWRAFYDGRPDLAKGVFADVAQSAPHRGDAHLGLGRCLMAEGAWDAASTALDDAAEADPTLASPLLYRGLILYGEENFKAALATFLDGWRRLDVAFPTPESRDMAYLLGRVNLALGDREAGARWTRLALEQGEALGQVEPTSGLLRLRDGSIPAPAFISLLEVPVLQVEGPLYFSHRGRGVRWQGGEPFLEQVSWPSPGGRDLYPAPGLTGDPQGGAPPLAVVHLPAGAGGKPEVVVQGEGGRRVVATGAALSAPTWGPDGRLYFVGEGPSGQVSLNYLAPGSLDVRVVPGGPEGRVMDPLALPNGAGMVLASERAGGLRLGHLSGVGGMRWLTDVPHGIDPYLVMGGDDTPTPTPTPPEGEGTPLPPLLVGDPFPGDSALKGVVPDRQTSKVAHRPQPKGRYLWSPEDGAKEPPTPPDPEAQRIRELKERAPKAGTWTGGTPLMGPGEGDERHPALGPGGAIAFSRLIQGRRRVWLLEADGDTQRPITAPNRDCAEPVFTPEGAGLIYICGVPGRRGPYHLDLASGEEMPLLSIRGDLISPTF